MSDWGDEFEAGPQTASTDAVTDASPAPRRAFGVDVPALAAEVVDVAVKAAIRKEIAKIGAEAAADALTEDVLVKLRERAAEAARAAVDEQVAANDADAAAAAESEAEADAEPQPRLYYGSVDEFVREYLRYAYKRVITGTGTGHHWAADWWRYDEAVIRLEAIWRAWEALRLDAATGMSTWWRDHADYHMGVLLDADGPFKGAQGDDHKNKRGEPLPYLAPPPELFPDVREPLDAAAVESPAEAA
ncbi:DUF4913 domain-containing protein [Agromyces neolithicus]|uniref:DUF4913 domain-containing protein n=1 Tax=Agromyces neolithicus TaxID=269420 RepID=A0ABN2MED9_9MICO